MENVGKETIKSKKELALERLKSKHPDSTFEDDESIYGQFNDDYDDYDAKLNEYADREQKFSDLFSSDPRSAAFLTSWRDGEDPVMFLIRTFGEDIREALDDPKRQEEIAEANKEYLERVAQNKSSEEEYKNNLKNSLAFVDNLQKERGLSDDQIDEALYFLLNIANDAINGRFTPESIDMALKAINYDTAVEKANHEGEVKGRNANIEEKLRKVRTNDGTANLSGTSAAPQPRPVARSIFDIAEGAK